MKALLIIDMQNDFMPWGALPVFQSDQLIEVIKPLEKKFSHIYASQDWHPQDHISFASNHGKRPGEEIATSYGMQTLWPPHCVEHSLGADLVAPLQKFSYKKIFHKGTKSSVDSYSVFFDAKGIQSTGIEKELKKSGIKELYFAGVASDYCVKHSILDALSLGFVCYYIQDACKFASKDSLIQERCYRELVEKGCRYIFSDQIK